MPGDPVSDTAGNAGDGMGKSSLIQSLLLLRQSFEKNILFEKGLLLKGDYLSLGTGQDVLAENAEQETWQSIGAIERGLAS